MFSNPLFISSFDPVEERFNSAPCKMLMWWDDHLYFSHLIHIAPILNISSPILVSGCDHKWFVEMNWAVSRSSMLADMDSKRSARAWIMRRVSYFKFVEPYSACSITNFAFTKLFQQFFTCFHSISPYWNSYKIQSRHYYPIAFHLKLTWIISLVQVIGQYVFSDNKKETNIRQKTHHIPVETCCNQNR